MSDSLISIILPVYNQADHIARVVEEYEDALDKLDHPHETLLVVNGCRDNSLEICQQLAETRPAVRVLHLEIGGWGRAVRHGLSEARGDLLCYTNSARTSTQDLILLLLYAVVYPNVAIKANRKVRESFFRRLGSLIYNLECRALFDLANWDINGTPKIFPRKFDRLLELDRDDDLIDAEFNAVCSRERYPFVEIPILAGARHGGKSTTKIRSALKMYWGAIELRKSLREGGR